MKRSTIKDVAKEADVSVSTVSRVFTEGASASENMRKRVLTAADALGYRPSQIASGLVQGRTRLVTFVVGQSFGTFDLLFLEALTTALTRAGFRLMLTAVEDNSVTGGLMLAIDYQSDAVIVSAGTLSEEQSQLCLGVGLPVILIGREAEGQGIHCMLPDNRGGARQAGDLLLRTSCRRIAYLGRGGATFADVERREGLREVVTRAGRELIVGKTAGRSAEDHFQAALRLLSADPRADGVFCASDSIAIGVIEAARALHLDTPEDVSVIGFNNGPVAALRSFRLSSVDYPIESLVRTILDVLQSGTDDPADPCRITRIPTVLVPRSTTRELPVPGGPGP